VPQVYWLITTFIAGLRHHAIVAPLVIDRPMNGECLLAYLEHRLAPTLSPGDIVVMDNLPAHKIDGVQDIITVSSAELRYLPAYSPDLNPIEMVFSKLKTLLRDAAERILDDLWSRIGPLLDRFSPEECTNYFRYAEYQTS